MTDLTPEQALNEIREVLADTWPEGIVLTQFLNATDNARVRAIRAILARVTPGTVGVEAEAARRYPGHAKKDMHKAGYYAFIAGARYAANLPVEGGQDSE